MGDLDGRTIVAEGMALGRGGIGLTGVGDAVAFPAGIFAAGEVLGAVEADGVAVGGGVNLRSGILVTGRAVADAVGDGVDVGASVDLRTGVPVGLADGETVALALALGDGDDVGVGRTVGLRNGVAVGLADGETVALATGNALLAGVAGAAVVWATATAGFINVFEGASAGGVDSDFIWARAFSAACRSLMPSQPRSTTTVATGSLTVFGRSTA